jgi:hypothetical protein
MPGPVKKAVVKKTAPKAPEVEAESSVVEFTYSTATKNKYVYVEGGGENILSGQKLYLAKDHIGDTPPKTCTITVDFK